MWCNLVSQLIDDKNKHCIHWFSFKLVYFHFEVFFFFLLDTQMIASNVSRACHGNLDFKLLGSDWNRKCKATHGLWPICFPSFWLSFLLTWNFLRLSKLIKVEHASVLAGSWYNVQAVTYLRALLFQLTFAEARMVHLHIHLPVFPGVFGGKYTCDAVS